MTTPDGRPLCPECGVLPPSVPLVREDGSTYTLSQAPEHARDCPFYGFPAQPRRVPGPGLVPGS